MAVFRGGFGIAWGLTFGERGLFGGMNDCFETRDAGAINATKHAVMV